MSDSSKPNEQDVEIFHRVNRLKIKAGGDTHDSSLGQIDPAAVDKASAVITQAAEMYPMQIKNVLKLLNKAWDETKGQSPEQRKQKAERISNLANNVKDLALQFGFEIMGYFGGSLRDYIMKSDLTKPEHVIIVQAHIDVMDVAYREGLKDEESPMAEELKQVIAKAIAKYS